MLSATSYWRYWLIPWEKLTGAVARVCVSRRRLQPQAEGRLREDVGPPQRMRVTRPSRERTGTAGAMADGGAVVVLL